MKHVCGKCGKPAKWAPKWCVPATGWPIDCHTPLSALGSFPCCDICIEELNAKAMFAENPHFKDIFEMMARGVKGLPPDFDRAFMTKVRLDSDEYRKFLEITEQSKAKGVMQ